MGRWPELRVSATLQDGSHNGLTAIKVNYLYWWWRATLKEQGGWINYEQKMTFLFTPYESRLNLFYQSPMLALFNIT